MSTSSPAPKMWIGKPFNARDNSLNLLRLILATSVLFHHTFPITGSHWEPVIVDDSIGGWAVIGFFTISGYLIAASRESKSFGDYLTLRIARIFPAFLVCNLLTILAFAPISYARHHGTLRGYLSAPTTPFSYIFENLFLKMQKYDVAATPIDVPYEGAWNGSLWTLYYEFWCYLLVGLLACLSIYRRSVWGPTVVWALSVALMAGLPSLSVYWQDNFDIYWLAKLVPYFMAGAILAALRKKVGMHWALALGGIIFFLVCLFLIPRWGGQLGSVGLAYFILWLGSVVPCPRVFQTHDVSYGMYIYAFQCQQICAVFGLASLGYWAFSFISLALTIPLAIASWFLVERPIINRTRDALKRNQPPREVAPAAPSAIS